MLIVTILVFLLVLSVLVLIHELGHFLTAKKFGVKVEEFGLGLPPRVWGKKIKGTIYSINALPFGGFVKLKGEDPTEEGAHDKNSFYSKSLGARAVMLSAGVVANILLGVIIFYFLVGFGGFRFTWPSFFDYNFRFADQFNGVLIGEIEKDSPAQKAGLSDFLLITGAAGQKVGSVDQLRGITGSNAGKEITISTFNPDSNQAGEVKVVPRTEPEKVKGTIGVILSPVPFTVVSYNNFVSRALVGFAHSENLMELNFKAIGKLIEASISRRTVAPISQSIGGPIAIAQVTGEAVSVGPGALVEFVAILSLTLGVINILPFPALDGGRLFFVGVEWITRRKINPRIEQAVNTVGFFILISLIVLVSFNDVWRIISGTPFGSGVLELFK